jgi:hypothetical protein
MNMIRHHDEGVELVTVKLAVPVPQRRYDHLRNFRAAQIRRASGGCVQQAVDGYERFTRRDEPGWREYPVVRKTAVQSEGYEGLFDCVPMGQPPFVMPHTSSWCFDGGILKKLWGGQSCPQPAFSRLWQL